MIVFYCSRDGLNSCGKDAVDAKFCWWWWWSDISKCGMTLSKYFLLYNNCKNRQKV